MEDKDVAPIEGWSPGGQGRVLGPYEKMGPLADTPRPWRLLKEGRSWTAAPGFYACVWGTDGRAHPLHLPEGGVFEGPLAWAPLPDDGQWAARFAHALRRGRLARATWGVLTLLLGVGMAAVIWMAGLMALQAILFGAIFAACFGTFGFLFGRDVRQGRDLVIPAPRAQAGGDSGGGEGVVFAPMYGGGDGSDGGDGGGDGGD